MQEVKRVQRLVGEHGRPGAISRVEHEERRLIEIVSGYGAWTRRTPADTAQPCT